ncbi:MAG: serine protein kinase RIO [Candidatus Woesearchaeota archaeon]
MAKQSKEAWKTYANVFDAFTMRNLTWLEAQGTFDRLTQAIEVGKEANVFVAESESGKVIVKIYRLENCNFNKMFEYLKGDPRFPSLKPRRREIVFAWTLREYRNILVARNAHVNVPTPIIQHKNILVEEFIGEDSAAPKLKDVGFDDKTIATCFKDTMKELRKLWHKAGIVHGDLSGFNILYHNNKPVIIDFSQATSIKDSRAREYLERDAKNLATFFTKRGFDCTADEIVAIILKKPKESTKTE